MGACHTTFNLFPCCGLGMSLNILYLMPFNNNTFCSIQKENVFPFLFLLFLAHRLLFSCRSEFISNQNAIDKRPILITSPFAYLHINDCRLCCFSAAAAPSLCYCSPHAATPCLSLSSRLHTCSLQLTFKGHFVISTIKGNRLIV